MRSACGCMHYGADTAATRTATTARLRLTRLILLILMMILPLMILVLLASPLMQLLEAASGGSALTQLCDAAADVQRRITARPVAVVDCSTRFG